MLIKRPIWPSGQLVAVEHDSVVLRGNRLGDPTLRQHFVWLPPGYDDSDRRYPVLFDLVGFTGSGASHTNWKNFGENVPERLARLIGEGKMPPVIVVFPDCFTSLGGNQYINSSAVGRYADYLTLELIPLIDERFKTLAHRDHRGCFGKSSGGYGAIIHGMRYAQFWGAVADHSGDCFFEAVYEPDWYPTMDLLAKFAPAKVAHGPVDLRSWGGATAEGKDDGRIQAFLEHFWKKDKSSDKDVLGLMMICMAATYDPDDTAPLGFRVPFNLDTAERLDERWARWREHDPVQLVASCRDALASLKGIYIDCGSTDQFRIHYGTRLLSRRLHEVGIAHVYEEYPDNHSSVDYRMDVSLPYLANVLQ